MHWDKHLQAFEQGAAAYEKRREEAKHRLLEIRGRLKEMHDKTTASLEEGALDADLEEEHQDTDAAPLASSVKKMRDAMNSAMATVRATAEEASPRRKVSQAGMQQLPAQPVPPDGIGKTPPQ